MYIMICERDISFKKLWETKYKLAILTLDFVIYRMRHKRQTCITLHFVIIFWWKRQVVVYVLDKAPTITTINKQFRYISLFVIIINDANLASIHNLDYDNSNKLQTFVSNICQVLSKRSRKRCVLHSLAALMINSQYVLPRLYFLLLWDSLSTYVISWLPSFIPAWWGQAAGGTYSCPVVTRYIHWIVW